MADSISPSKSLQTRYRDPLDKLKMMCCNLISQRPKGGRMGLSTLSINEYLEKNLRPKRLDHCKRVLKLMVDVQPTYGLDLKQAGLSALLHDIAKHFPETTLVSQLAQKDIKTLLWLPENCRCSIYLHGPVGSILVQELWPDIDDPAILDAICQHTWSFMERPTLSRCLAVADIIERIDKSDSDGDLRKYFMEGDLDRAELLMIAFGLEHYKAKGFPIHPNTWIRRQELKTKLGLNSSHLTRDPH